MVKRILSANFKNKIRTYFLRGNNVECSTCSIKLVTFLPSGTPLRSNAICPNCESLERTRITWYYLSNTPSFFETKKTILHTAPEKVLFKLFSGNKNINYSAIDKFEVGYSYPKGTLIMNILDLNFPDNHFNFILSSHVLEHIDDDIKAMKEFHRVLSHKGFAILQVPMDISKTATYEDFSITEPKERAKAFGQFDHVRVYGLDYKDRLESAGFAVEIDNYSVNLSPEKKLNLALALAWENQSIS